MNVKRLIELRNEKGLSGAQLAERIGITRQAMNKYERELLSPSTAVLKQMAIELGCTMDYLMGLSNEKSG